MSNLDWSEIISNIKKRNFSPFLQPIYKAAFRILPHEGDNVLDEDWDYLIVLDACRYDMFEELNTIDGNLEKRTSVASMTAEWLEKTFSGKFHEDLVYIAANPHVSKTVMGNTLDPEKHFFDHYLPFLRDECKEFGVAVPESVSEDARKAINKNPDKRAIIHYNQPHAPYIGQKKLDGSLYELYSKGVSQEELIEAYRKNLERVLSEVDGLIKDLDGTIVVTADHGEMLGEKGIYAHGRGLYLKELVEVPWLVIEKDVSRELEVNKSEKEPRDYDEDDIKKQLSKLGYEATE